MADIFISYAREDREVARVLASQLERIGWSVWWDRHILAGRDFNDVLQEEIDRTRCVLVIWSRHSVASRWVKAEATVGLERNMLIPVRIDDLTPPLAFRNIQTVIFPGGEVDRHSREFDDLVRSLKALLGTPVSSVRAAPDRTAAPERTAPRDDAAPSVRLETLGGDSHVDRPGGRSPWMPFAIAAGCTLAAIAVWIVVRPHSAPVPRQPSTEDQAQPPQARADSTPPAVPKPVPAAAQPAAPDSPPVSRGPAVGDVGAPTTSPAEAAAAPEAPLSPADARSFVEDLIATTNSGNLARLLTFYSDRVEYFDMGTVGRDAIQRDKQAYRKRWPQVKLQLSGDVAVRPGQAPGTAVLEFTSDYDLRSARRNAQATGQATTTLIVKIGADGRPSIISQREQVQPQKS